MNLHSVQGSFEKKVDLCAFVYLYFLPIFIAYLCITEQCRHNMGGHSTAFQVNKIKGGARWGEIAILFLLW